MIESKNEASRNLEKALQALEQAKQRVAQRKEEAEREKAESGEPPQVHHGRYYREVFSRLLPI